ncbi:MAG: Panacea domain-containing protein [Dehalococcoidia bacterium]
MKKLKIKEKEFDKNKFKELVLYIATKCESNAYYGATKLNKILFFSDFIAHEEIGESITGADYFALEHGPAPRLLKPIQEQMQKAGEIAIEQRTRQVRTIALREPKLDSFSAAEIAIVDEVIKALCDRNANEVSDMSHGFLGWKAAWTESQATRRSVSIPYDTVFVSNPHMDEYEKAIGLEKAKKYGWIAEKKSPVRV